MRPATTISKTISFERQQQGGIQQFILFTAGDVHDPSVTRTLGSVRTDEERGTSRTCAKWHSVGQARRFIVGPGPML